MKTKQPGTFTFIEVIGALIILVTFAAVCIPSYVKVSSLHWQQTVISQGIAKKQSLIDLGDQLYYSPNDLATTDRDIEDYLRRHPDLVFLIAVSADSRRPCIDYLRGRIRLLQASSDLTNGYFVIFTERGSGQAK